MRRFVASGLVPCDPVALADHLLDAGSAPVIWPQLRSPQSAAGWMEVSLADSEDELPAGTLLVRLRRASPAEVIERSEGGVTVHRFLPATGGCLWSVESHAERLPGESPAHFARRRSRERERAVALVDTAASYFASLL